MQRFNEVALRSPTKRRLGVEWCNEHGIAASSVPLFAKVDYLTGNQPFLELEVYDLDTYGQHQVDSDELQARTRWLQVRYNRPIPEELLEDC